MGRLVYVALNAYILVILHWSPGNLTQAFRMPAAQTNACLFQNNLIWWTWPSYCLTQGLAIPRNLSNCGIVSSFILVWWVLAMRISRIITIIVTWIFPVTLAEQKKYLWSVRHQQQSLSTFWIWLQILRASLLGKREFRARQPVPLWTSLTATCIRTYLDSNKPLKAYSPRGNRQKS